jgi:hypothetical protein
LCCEKDPKQIAVLSIKKPVERIVELVHPPTALTDRFMAMLTIIDAHRGREAIHCGP